MSFDWIVPLLGDFLEREGAVSAFVSSWQPAVGAFENNCSELTRVRIDLLAADGEKRTVSVIVKMDSEAIMSAKPLVQETDMSRREISVYKGFLRPMKKIFMQYGFEIMWPECMGYRNCDTLIMEDLKTMGYTVGDRLKGYDVDHLSFLVRELAKFHALAAVSQERGIIETSQLSRYPFALRKKHSISYIEASFRNVRDLTASKWPETARQKYAEILEKLPNIAYDEFVKTLEKPGFKLFNHGDYWVNNILIKYDKATAKPMKLKMVDFQLSHYGSFAMDLHYLFATSIHCEFDREDVIDSLIVEYHACLKSTLEACEYGKRPPTLEEVRSEIEATLFSRLVFATVFLPIVMQKDTEKSESSPLKGDTKTRMKHRFADETFCQVLLRIYDQLWNRGLFKSF